MSSGLFSFGYTKAALRALKDIEKGAGKGAVHQIVGKIERLQNDPNPPRSRQVVNVEHPGGPVRRIRSGDYRVLYVALEDEKRILVLDIGHRKDVYRDF